MAITTPFLGPRARTTRCALFALLLTLPGCSGCGDDDPAGAPGGGAGGSPPPPPPVAVESPPCVLNADCPAGQYCDLGECIQDCNVERACAEGLVCSPRGRCLPPDEPERQAVPAAEPAGTIAVEPTSIVLAPTDRVLALKLTSSSPKPVRYRLELSAPHLRADVLRGEFTGSTTLELAVDPTRAKSKGTAGSVRILTTLGDLSVSAPVQPGLTGYYQGTMRYEVGGVTLGDAAVGVEIVENAGEVSVRFDPSASLLFPETPPLGGTGTKAAATGVGRYAKADGKVDATVYQSLPAAFAGERNYFGRPVLRQIRLDLVPGSLGTIEGTFVEDVHGVFPQAARATGRVSLLYTADRPVSAFTAVREPPSGVPQVVVGNYMAPRDAFGWMGAGGVYCSQVAADGCELLPPSDVAACRGNLAAAAPGLAALLLKPLYDDMALSDRTTLPFQTMADRCRAAFGVKTYAEYAADEDAKGCGLIAPHACLLDVVGNSNADAAAKGQLYSELVARLAAPALLVAKDEITLGLEASFRQGLVEEGRRYDDALATIRPVGLWLLQPNVVEALRAMPEEGARGRDVPSSTSTVFESYPAARNLTSLFHTLSTVDAERARISAALTSSAPQAAVQKTQERAVLAYLEAATLGHVVSAWQGVPPNLMSRFSGTLSPINRGFSALVQDGTILGVPEGFVPFVYRPEDLGKAGPTNFEQMLGLAKNALEAEASAEEGWLAAGRQFEANNNTLQAELSAIRNQFDRRLREICGPTFDPTSVGGVDWEVCGRNGGDGAGDLGLRRAEAARAHEALLNHHRRVNARFVSYRLELLTAAQVLRMRDDQIVFEAVTGSAIIALSLAQGILTSVQRSLEVASNAQLFNAGAPVAMGVTVGVMEGVKVGLQTTKDGLQLAQQLRASRVSADVEFVQAMARAQQLLIEMSQLAVEAHEATLVLLQARIAERNALDEARALLEERGRVLAVLGKNPANDPSFRLIRDQRATELLRLRAGAQTQLYLAGKALEFELNMSLGALDGAVLNANNAYALGQLSHCFTGVHDQRRVAFGSPQEYVTTVSVRKALGVTGPRVDEVTGEELSEGRQFREHLLRNQNFDGKGGVGLAFATTLDADNGLWSTDVCSDRIASVEAQLVGDFLGDDEAQVNLALAGTSLVRACDSDAIEPWLLGGEQSSSAVAVLQAGVNAFGKGAPNTALFGQSVARATWTLTIPGGAAAPANADLDLTRVDDIVLRITHKALARRTSPWQPDLSCLGF
ncbi:MAG TPA: hypothetical protein VFS43_08590 [Polyangiaceae bacterium]|nr:hypothetical protein [Polyangiaceae bacterium]